MFAKSENEVVLTKVSISLISFYFNQFLRLYLEMPKGD